MENKFIINIIHRPELNPEYSEKVLGRGKKEVDKDAALNDESLDIFKLQQKIAHDNGLKTTIHMTYASMFNDYVVELAKKYHEEYGDEIGLSLLGLPCEEFKKKYKTKDFCIWMFSLEDKKRIIDDCFEFFKEKFGFYPTSTGAYFLDADCINYIKEKYPMVVSVIATCFEEGPKAYHTCNNSWYTFFDGGPWAPWIPSKVNSHCPAESEEDDSGVVAIPHLSRDLIACFDGNGSNFGTHPQNVLRGMIYTHEGEIPYYYNLVDQYRNLAKYNNGLGYNMIFVGPGWMNKAGRWEAPYELLVKSYEDGMAYYGKLKKEGKLVDMGMSEFANYFRKVKSYKEPEVALWKDILYGSSKEHLWYIDSSLRTCLDFNLGGAMIDLRPYVGRLDWKCGIGTDHIYDASYPYLIQANYRAGFFTHYAGAGTVKSLKVKYGDEVIDLCLERTLAKVDRYNEEHKTVCTVNPVTVKFKDFDCVIQSVITFTDGSGEITFERNILNDIGDRKVEFEEYFTGAFGTTEYQADMSKILLEVANNSKKEEIQFAYKCNIIRLENVNYVKAIIPDVNTEVIVDGDNDFGEFEEGHAFSPTYRLSLIKKVKSKGGMKTCLKLRKVN